MKKGKKCAGEQVKPGAGRSAGSYKFPDLLWGPHVDVNLGKSEAAARFRTVSRRTGGPFSVLSRFRPTCAGFNV